MVFRRQVIACNDLAAHLLALQSSEHKHEDTWGRKGNNWRINSMKGSSWKIATAFLKTPGICITIYVCGNIYN